MFWLRNTVPLIFVQPLNVLLLWAMNLISHMRSSNENWREFTCHSPKSLCGTASSLYEQIHQRQWPQLVIQSIVVLGKMIYTESLFRVVLILDWLTMEPEKILVSTVCPRSWFSATRLIFCPQNQATTLDISVLSSHSRSALFPLYLPMVLRLQNTLHMLNGTLLFLTVPHPIISCTKFYCRRIKMGRRCVVLFR